MKSSRMSPIILAMAGCLAAPLAAHAQNAEPAQGGAMRQAGPGMRGEGWPMHGGPGMGGSGMEGHSRPGGMGHGMEHGPHGMASFLHGLNLTEAQQDRVFAIMHAQAPQMREHHKAVAKAHEELRALAMSGQFDDNKASALAKAAGQAMSAAALLEARTDAQLLAVLTPEQREQVAKRGARAAHPRP